MPKSTKRLRKNPDLIYLDYAASVMPNPGSIHSEGLDARVKLENSRSIVARTLSARPREIIFTSGGTESNNLAMLGLIQNFIKPHIVTSNIEHPSVLDTCRMLENRKLAEISIVPVEANGIVDPKKIKKALKRNTVLVSVMYANNEIGTIQPIREIAREIRHYKKQNKINNIYFHTDAVQAANYLDLNVQKLGVDLLSLSGSKIVGAGRVGALYKKNSVPLANIFGGGDQEGGLRPGTENLPEILKFADALESAQTMKEKEAKRLTILRDCFFEKLRGNAFLKSPRSPSQKLGQTFKNSISSPLIINGDLKNRLPNNVNISFQNIPSDLLVIELSARGVMVSAKSACKSGEAGGSYVIAAIRPLADPEIGGVRFSLGRGTTKSDIDYTVKALTEIVIKLEKWYN